MAIFKSVNSTKFYGSIKALSGVSIEVTQPGVFCLVGPNGAGKTTFVKCMLGLLQFNSGEFYINDITVNNKKSREEVAFLPEKFNFHPFYTVQETLHFFARLKCIPNTKERVDQAIDKLSLTEIKARKLKTLSKGQLQRVGLANVYLQDAQFVVLDEPFSGLDPIGIRELKHMIAAWKEKNKSIFINSHILSEMQQIGDEFATLNNGQLIAQKKINELSGESLEDYFHKQIEGAHGSIS